MNSDDAEGEDQLFYVLEVQQQCCSPKSWLIHVGWQIVCWQQNDREVNVEEEDFKWHFLKLVYELGAAVGQQTAMEPVKMEDLLDAWGAMAGMN